MTSNRRASAPLHESRTVVPGCGILRRKHLVLQILTGVHKEAFADQLVKETEVAALYPTKMMMLIWLGARAKPPDGPTRRKYSNMLVDYADTALGIAFHVGGKGFAASMQRSVLTGYNILAPHQMRTFVAGSTDGAVDWFGKCGASSEDVAEMRHMLTALNSAMQALDQAA